MTGGEVVVDCCGPGGPPGGTRRTLREGVEGPVRSFEEEGPPWGQRGRRGGESPGWGRQGREGGPARPSPSCFV